MNSTTIITSSVEEKPQIPQPNTIKGTLIKILQESSENEQDLLNRLKDFVFLMFPEIPKILKEKKDLTKLPPNIESESNIETSETERQNKEKENENNFLGKKRKKEDKIKEEKDATISENSSSLNKLNDLVKKYKLTNVIKALYKPSLDESILLDAVLLKIIDEIGKEKLIFMLLDILCTKFDNIFQNKEAPLPLEEKEKEKIKDNKKAGRQKEKSKKREASKPFAIRKNNKNSNNSQAPEPISEPNQKIKQVNDMNISALTNSSNISNITNIEPEKKDENINKANLIINPEIIKNTNNTEILKNNSNNNINANINDQKINLGENDKSIQPIDNNLLQKGGSSSRFRKELGLGVHFHKDENNNIYKYCLHHFLGETRAIFYCSDKQCKSIAKYDVDSKDFVVTFQHSKPHAQHNYIMNFDTEKKDKIIFLDFQKKDYKEGQVFRKGEGKRIVQWYNC